MIENISRNTDSVLLEVKGLTKRYYGLTAVNDLSFSVRRETITGLIGPNGSGKSTTIDCISGFQKTDAGRWFLNGKEFSGKSPHKHALAGMTRTFQNVRAYGELSLLENMLLASQEHDGVGWLEALRKGRILRDAEVVARDRAETLLETVDLSQYTYAPVEILSYGQRKLLSIAATMMARPQIVILDEPVAGVNPTMINRIETVLRQMFDEGVTLLIVEHNMDFIMTLCNRVIVLVEGMHFAEGPPELIQNDPRVLEAYLGVDINNKVQA
jgi:branched-chain amino acid transport system ATP-binding protein